MKPQNERKKINQFPLEKKSILFQFWQFLNELYASYKPKFIDISMKRRPGDRLDN